MKAQPSTPTLLCTPEPTLGGWKARREEARTGGEVEFCVILDWTSSVTRSLCKIFLENIFHHRD